MEYLQEIQKPIVFTMDEIRADMITYETNFDMSIIPHINESNQVVDNIHNYL